MDLACEVNERGTRGKNDGNEVVDNCDLPLDLELTTEPVEVDDETLLYAEEDWDCPEQTEIDKGVQPDFPFTMETRQSKKGRNKKKYNPYGEDFVIDRIVLSNMMESLVGLDEVAVPQEIDLVNDMDQDWIDDRSEPEVEFEPEVEQTHEHAYQGIRLPCKNDQDYCDPATRTQATIVWFPEDTCTTFQIAKIHPRMIKFQQKYFIDSSPFDKVNPDKIRSNTNRKKY